MVRKVLDPNFKIKTFNIKYDREISKHVKVILESFKLKFYYYAIDDISYSLKYDETESKYLIKILNSTAIFLQNNFGVNFFDIYIYDIQVDETPKINRLTDSQEGSFKISNNLIIKLAYQVKAVQESIDRTWY